MTGSLGQAATRAFCTQLSSLYQTEPSEPNSHRHEPISADLSPQGQALALRLRLKTWTAYDKAEAISGAPIEERILLLDALSTNESDMAIKEEIMTAMIDAMPEKAGEIKVMQQKMAEEVSRYNIMPPSHRGGGLFS